MKYQDKMTIMNNKITLSVQVD
jgi:hypothetical protein